MTRHRTNCMLRKLSRLPDTGRENIIKLSEASVWPLFYGLTEMHVFRAISGFTIRIRMVKPKTIILPICSVKHISGDSIPDVFFLTPGLPAWKISDWSEVLNGNGWHGSDVTGWSILTAKRIDVYT